MSWRTYATNFMLLAFLFVPVLFFFGFGGLVSPCCYAVYEFMNTNDGGGRSIFAIHFAMYFFGFFFLAYASFRLSQFAPEGAIRKGVQAAFLLLLFSCSFLTVIQESAAGGGDSYNSGTYNFWTACARFPHTSHR
jgi:hypothetical protein